MCHQGERKACNHIVLWMFDFLALMRFDVHVPLCFVHVMSRCVMAEVLVNSQIHVTKGLIFTFNLHVLLTFKHKG